MKSMSKTAAGLLMSLALIFTFSSCTKKEETSKAAVGKEAPEMTPEQIIKRAELKKGVEESKQLVVARVNGSDITMYSLIKEMNGIAPRFVPAGQRATPEITARVKKEALKELIFKELAVQEAIRQGLKVKPDAVEDVIKKVKARAGSEEAFKKYLQDRNVDEDALRKIIERSHLFEMITAREVFERIEVDDKDLRDRYEREKSFLMTKDNPPRQLSFEEARVLLLGKIKSERSGKRIAQWDNELRRSAKIEILPEAHEKL